MSAVTTQTLDQSYTILALIDVCAAAARNMKMATMGRERQQALPVASGNA
ncbi:hypothetical protein [Phyllobacterium sp. P5_D12]